MHLSQWMRSLPLLAMHLPQWMRSLPLLAMHLPQWMTVSPEIGCLKRSSRGTGLYSANRERRENVAADCDASSPMDEIVAAACNASSPKDEAHRTGKDAKTLPLLAMHLPQWIRSLRLLAMHLPQWMTVSPTIGCLKSSSRGTGLKMHISRCICRSLTTLVSFVEP